MSLGSDPGRPACVLTRKPGDLPGDHPFPARGAHGKRHFRSGGNSLACGWYTPSAGLLCQTQVMPAWWGAFMVRTQISLAALCALLTPAYVVAEETAAEEGILLDEVVISGGLTPIAADAYGSAYTVVTADDMAERGIRTVQDALRDVPGLAMNSTGGGFTQLRIRGAEANHALVLIDGVKVSGGHDEYIFSGLETANIDRIEVLRGPQSVFYGSSASAGVVNIITRKGGMGTQYGGSLEVGNGHSASAWVTHRTEAGGLSFSTSTRDDRGYNQSFTGDEKDGIRRRTMALVGDWQVSEDLTLGVVMRHSNEDYDYDASNWTPTGNEDYLLDSDDRLDRRETLGALWAEYSAMGGRLLHRLEYQDSIYRQSRNSGPFTRGETKALKYRLSYALDGRQLGQADHMLNVMLERTEDRHSTAPDADRANTSVAMEYRGSFDHGIDVQGGLRHDNFTRFDDFTSWNLGLSWQIENTPLRLHVSGGRGLVEPSYAELFADDAWTRGNPDLVPERNTGFDIGIEAEFAQGRGQVDLTYFNEKMADEITYIGMYLPDGRGSYLNQSGDSKRQGVELAASYEFPAGLRLSGTYTYLDATEPDGRIEIRRPRHSLGLAARYALPGDRGYLAMDMRHVSGNYDTQWWGSYSDVVLPAYTVFNLSGGYDVTDNIRATARVVNLFDKSYMDSWGYATQGRAAYVGLEAKW